MNLHLETLTLPDVKAAKTLIKLVVTDSFVKQGVDIVARQTVLHEQINLVQTKFDHFSKEHYHFLVAKSDNQLIGTIGFGPINEPLKLALSQLALPNTAMTEIVSVYIHPDFQGKGVGSALLQAIFEQARQRDYQSFGLSTGYLQAKAFWSAKLGNPNVCLHKYFGNADCWVWIRKLS